MSFEVWAVIGGFSSEVYTGESFNSLKLFDCESKAKEYAVELESDGYDYVLIKKREVCMDSAIPSA